MGWCGGGFALSSPALCSGTVLGPLVLVTLEQPTEACPELFEVLRRNIC